MPPCCATAGCPLPRLLSRRLSCLILLFLSEWTPTWPRAPLALAFSLCAPLVYAATALSLLAAHFHGLLGGFSLRFQLALAHSCSSPTLACTFAVAASILICAAGMPRAVAVSVSLRHVLLQRLLALFHERFALSRSFLSSLWLAVAPRPPWQACLLSQPPFHWHRSL